MLRIVDDAVALIREVAPIAERVGRRDPALAKQLRDALNSAVLNLAEGGAQRGARRGNHYAIALGSAREAEVALRAAAAWGYVGPTPPDVVAGFRVVIGTLVKLERG